MPTPEEDITNSKLNFLKEQLVRLDTNLIRISKTDENKMKDCGQKDIRIKLMNEKLFADKTNPEMIDNRQGYDRISNSNDRKSVTEKVLKSTELEKCPIERILKEISKIGPEFFKDILNYLKKRLDSKELANFSFSSDKEVLDSLNNSISDEISCTENDDMKDEDEMTSVKEAIFSQGITVVDTKDSGFSVDSENKVMNAETVDGNSKAQLVSELQTQQMNKLNCHQSKNVGDQTWIETLKSDDGIVMKYIIDVMETEKNDIGNEKEKKMKSEDVHEKQDVEIAEKYFQKLEYAECQDYTLMPCFEPLSDVSVEPMTMPSFFTSCFLSVESDYMESCSPITFSLDSDMVFGENRLSLEWLIPRNICFNCNIIASRQTNMPSLFVSEDKAFSLNGGLHSGTEEVLLHVERKASNLVFSDSLDFNVYKGSLSNKCESKGVLDLWDIYFRELEDSMSKPFCLDIQEKMIIDRCYKKELDADILNKYDDFEDPGSMNELREEINEKIEGVKGSKCDFERLQEEEPESICKSTRDMDDSFYQNHIGEKDVNFHCEILTDQVQKEIEGSFGELKGDNRDKDEEIEGSFAELKDDNRDKDEENADSFAELKDLESSSEYKEVQKDYTAKIIGEMKDPDIKGYNKIVQEIVIEDKCRKQKNQDYRQCKEIMRLPQYCENDGSRVDDLSSPELNQDVEQNLQEICQKDSWKYVFPSTSGMKGNKKKQRYLPRKDFKEDKKYFEKKSRYDINKVTLCQNQNNRNLRNKKTIKQKNLAKFKHDKTAGKTESGERWMQFIHMDIFMKKQQSTQGTKDVGGNFVHLNEDPPVRLHLVKAKVCNRSGGDGDHRSSNTGSSDGTQGNRNKSSSRDIGGAGHSANGNGSNSGGNGNNNNNNNNRNKSGENSDDQKSDNKSKSNKPKKAVDSSSDNESPSDTDKHSPHDKQSSRDKQINLPENVASLPPPRLDPVHVAERLARQIQNAYPPVMRPPGAKSASDQNEVLQASNEPEADFSGLQNLLPQEGETPNIHHAAVSIEQLCDTIGEATHGLPSGLDSFRNINTCLTRLIHDLKLAASEDKEASLDSCSVCLVLSQLLIHMADPEHDGFVRSCEQCAQIFNLMMQHCIGCIKSSRQTSRLTQSDLCYKICKYSQWKEDRLSCNVNRLKSKVQKYCDKVLGSTANMMPLRFLEGESFQVMGEMNVTNLSDMSSTNLSSSATLSLGGNIVTTETGDKEYASEEVQTSPGSANIPFVNTPTPTMTSSTAVMPLSNVPAGSSVNETAGHMRLTRKPSQSRKTPAIPPPIVEENQQLEQDEGKKDDIENIIYQRWGSRVDDPYETQKTYGERNQYESVPLHNIHDVAQFLSVSTRPLGMPGIGEVVFGHPSQLRIVARFWDKKREECERTQTCPYQHREEGVILAEQKENFGILHTRYQKHHQWERVSHLGNGMSGKCHLAIDMKTNFKFCCKKIHLLRYAEEELSLWSEMHNAYIVRLYGAIRHGVKIYIFSEFIDGGSLAACIEEQKRLGRRLSHWSAINYFQQLLKVLAFLQKKNILHEDIKGDNILLRRNSTYLAVTDFGSSRRLQDPKELKNKSPLGSPTHWSPEKASMEGHGFPSDLWAAVCVLVHMLSGEPPWVKRFMQKAAILNFVIYARSPPMEDVPDNVQLVVRDLIERGFVKDPQARPSSSELLQHPAFSILDEGTPETYFSTLTSMAHSGLHAVRTAAAASEQQDVKKEEPATNTLDPVPPEATVLFETKVTTGPYQESDSRPDNRNQKSNERLETSSQQTKATSKSQMEKSSDENDLEDIESNNGQTPFSGASEKNVTAQGNAVLIEGDKAAPSNKLDSKVHQLVMLDINKLLPQFNELFVSGDSINTQSIKSFFADVYSTSDLSDSRQSVLQVYRPEEKTDEIPNLSIFDASWEAGSQMNKEQRNATPASVSENENAIQNLSHIDVSAGVTNPPIRTWFQRSPSPSQSPMQFTLSSESDDYTSADLFEPTAKNSDTVHNTSSGMCTQAKNESSYSQKHTLCTSGDVSPTASSGSTFSSSGTSNLQQRKPVNLTLNVDCTSLPPVLTHSQSETQTSSVTSANELEQNHRSSTWSQLSTSTHASHHSGSAPSSSHATSAHRKTSGTSVPGTASSGHSQANGTSVPSTASSGHSQFSYRNFSVREEQERMIEELTMNILTGYSPTNSESEKSSFAEYLHQETTISGTREYEENTDTQTLCQTMLDEIDETKLAGHNLKFYNVKGDYLFTMRIEQLPMDWKRLITTVRQKINHCGFSHFSIHHMDNRPVKFHHPLAAREFKVSRQDQGNHCWCQQCQTMY